MNTISIVLTFQMHWETSKIFVQQYISYFEKSLNSVWLEQTHEESKINQKFWKQKRTNF